MKVAIIYNEDIEGVINTFGMQNKEFYNKNTISKVAKSLEKAGHNVVVFDGNKQIIERLESFMPRVLDGEQMGMVFNMAYGIQGESRYTHIPSMLEMLGIPYVGSSPSGHTLALDKVLTKIIWKNGNLPTPDFWVFNSPSEDLSKVKYPVIVKPKMESVSFGLKVVNNEDELREAVEFIINEFDQQALVEQFISGREFCVGLIGNSPVEAFPVLEIDLDGDPDAIQTVDDKKNKPRKKICPAIISNELAEQMQKVSIDAFKALNLRDFSRVDIRLDSNNNIYLLEINSMASMGETGSYPTAAMAAGYSFESLANRMLDVASVRYFANNIMSNLPGEKKQGKISLTVRMRSFLKTRQAQNEKLLKKIVDANTYVRNVEGVNYCTELIGNELSLLGFRSEIFPQFEVGNIFYHTNTQKKEDDYLLLLSVDNITKLALHENYNENEQYLEGTGIWENKGGIVTLISALQALRFSRALKKLNLGILLITDSSIDNKYTKSLIQQKSLNAKRVIAMSGSSINGGLVLSRSGSALYNYEMKLLNNSTPENVSLTAMSFNKTIASISDISRNDNENVIAPYKVNFSSNIFKIYAHGSANISVRFNSPITLKNIESKLQKIVSQQKRNKIYQTHFEGGQRRPPMEISQLTIDFYNEVKAITDKIDVRITKDHRWSSSDICHISDQIAKLDGLGPVGDYMKTNNERILRHSLIERSLLLALIIKS